MNVVMPISSPLAVPSGLGYYSDYAAAYSFNFPALDAPQGGAEVTKAEASSPGEGPGEFETQLFASDFTDLGSSCLGLEPEWLSQPLSALLTPEDQATDGFGTSPSAVFSPHTPPLGSSPQTIPGLLTPESSLPASPQSSCYYSPSEAAEIEDVMSSLLEDNQFSPVSCYSAATPLAPLSSPLTSADSTGSIRDLLLQKTEEQAVSSPCLYQEPPVTQIEAAAPARKRKAPSDQRKTTKRRMSVVQKKERKKEQNKTAALRYRQRKRAEKFGVDEQREALEAKNKKLKAEVQSLENEVNYLKKLWAEVDEARRRKSMGQRFL